MHGESECVGNKQQLCAAKYWRRESEEKKEGEKEEGQGEERGASWEDSWNVSFKFSDVPIYLLFSDSTLTLLMLFSAPA